MHKNLEVWQLSMDLVQQIYKSTGQFPKEEIYGLTNQMRRCAVSVPSNIAEGAARQSNKEFVQFLYISLGSCSELETQLLIANKLDYPNNPDHLIQLNRIKQMLLGLIKKRKDT